MSQVSPETSLSLAAERRINTVCDRFVAALAANRLPRIEEYLGEVPELERSALLRELLREELEYRGRCGESPALTEYLVRFPEQAAVVQRWYLPATVTETENGNGELTLPNLPGYQILEVLGRGGMGVVYRARQLGADRLVALKCIRDSQLAAPAEVERFQFEAKAAAQFDHPGIVPIYEVGTHNGQHYYSMRCLPGPTLAEQVARGSVSPRQAAEWVAGIAAAVEYGPHQRGILHRDLKPANIILDEQGRPHVTDFGLARRLDGASGLTHTGAVVGTPSYMAPEQAAGHSRELTPATDVYGLGAVLYALLVGKSPFQGEMAAEIVQRVLWERPVPPRVLNPKIDRDLETICLKCLEKEPAERYHSAAELAADLQRFLAGEAIRAHPPGWLDTLRRQLRSGPMVEPAAWAGIAFMATLIFTPAHVATYWLVQTAQPPVLFWLNYLLTTVGVWVVIWWYLGRRRTALTRDERHLLVLWSGQTVAIAVVWMAAGSPYDARIWSLYPAWGTLYALAFFVQGSLYWGWFYLLGAAWFVLALLMPLRLEWAPLEAAALYCVSMLLVWNYLRRLGA